VNNCAALGGALTLRSPERIQLTTSRLSLSIRTDTSCMPSLVESGLQKYFRDPGKTEP